MKKTLFLAALILFAGLLTACASDREQTHPVTIENRSSHAICSVRFYLAGPYHLHAKNLLKKSLFATGEIAPHQSVDVRVPPGVYDIRIETCDGLVYGADDFKVPDETSWRVTDNQLFKSVR